MFRLLHFIVVRTNGVRVMIFNAIFNNISVISWRLLKMHIPVDAGLTLEGDSGKEVALWLLTSLCTSAKREVEVVLWFYQVALLILTVKKHRYIFTTKFPFLKPPLQRDVIETVTNIKPVLRIRTWENNVGIVSFNLFGVWWRLSKGIVNFVDMINF